MNESRLDFRFDGKPYRCNLPGFECIITFARAELCSQRPLELHSVLIGSTSLGLKMSVLFSMSRDILQNFPCRINWNNWAPRKCKL